MSAIGSILVLMGGTALGTANPPDNIFKARVKTPIIEQAINDFQDICVTFMLHESDVSRSEDLEHFNSIIEASVYKTREKTTNEDTAETMGVYGRSDFSRYTHAQNNIDLTLRWRRQNRPLNFSRFSQVEREAIRNMPYGKNIGLSCSLSVELPKATKFSDIESEILNYDKDWQSPPPIDHGRFTDWVQLQPIEYYRFQSVKFEQNNFVFRVYFKDPDSAPKTTKKGEPNRWYDEDSYPMLHFVMERPFEEISKMTKW